MQFLAKKLHESNTINTYKHLLHLDSAVTLPSKFFFISSFGIYGAVVVPDSGVGNTWH